MRKMEIPLRMQTLALRIHGVINVDNPSSFESSNGVKIKSYDIVLKVKKGKITLYICR